MKITALTAQKKADNRVNVIVDGTYRFSLDVYQVIDLGIKVGNDYTEEELIRLEDESQFGKLYARALEYCLMRPHSAKEVRDYLYRKTLAKRTKSGELRPGASQATTERVFRRLEEKGYLDDERFAQWWIENRNQKKGTSLRKLAAELGAKGVSKGIIDKHLAQSVRSDEDELQKVIAKKRSRYSDPQKFMQYLARQGFSYDAIKEALADGDD